MVEERLSLLNSLIISLNGLLVVFSVLVILALATVLIAKLIGAVSHKDVKVESAVQSVVLTPAPQTLEEEDLSDVLAVLHGAISLESGIPVDKLEIKSIKEVADD